MAWHIDVSSVIWTVINNGKLAIQIARLVVIVLKDIILSHTTVYIAFCVVHNLSYKENVVCETLDST